MNRSKKLLKNIIIISLMLFLVYYFDGYFISKEECILHSLRGLYAKERTIITEVGNDKYSTAVVADLENKTVSLIGIKKEWGFFYRIGNASHGTKIDPENPIDVSGYYSTNYGNVMYVYRNDKNIEKVEVTLEDGNFIILDEWIHDFSVLYNETESWIRGIYRAYDANGELVYETEY